MDKFPKLDPVVALTLLKGTIKVDNRAKWLQLNEWHQLLLPSKTLKIGK